MSTVVAVDIVAAVNEIVAKSLSDLGVCDATSLRCYAVKDRDYDIECKVGELVYKMCSYEVTSSLGVVRTIASPLHLAELVVEDAEELQQHVVHTLVDKAGIVRMTSSQLLKHNRARGRLLCGVCGQFFRGAVGLTGHMQRVHAIEYKDGMTGAKSQLSTFVIADANNININAPAEDINGSDNTNTDSDIYRLAQTATPESFADAILAQPASFQIQTSLDKNGSTVLMWACGSNNLPLIKFLLDASCSPSVPQSGRRSFKGRTALHWAARGGHVNTVAHLLSGGFNVDIDASTADGTTAFCWAAWGGHLDVMKLLHAKGCDPFATNSFGCNALLWFSQSPNTTTECFEWLVDDLKFDLASKNRNSHTIIHKCAQRGNSEIIQLIMSNYREKLKPVHFGRDTDGMKPSELASADGRDAALSRLLEAQEFE